MDCKLKALYSESNCRLIIKRMFLYILVDKDRYHLIHKNILHWINGGKVSK